MYGVHLCELLVFIGFNVFRKVVYQKRRGMVSGIIGRFIGDFSRSIRSETFNLSDGGAPISILCMVNKGSEAGKLDVRMLVDHFGICRGNRVPRRKVLFNHIDMCGDQFHLRSLVICLLTCILHGFIRVVGEVLLFDFWPIIQSHTVFAICATSFEITSECCLTET